MECTSCAGKGIVGQGDFPLTLSGTLMVCEACVGKGSEGTTTVEAEAPYLEEEIVVDLEKDYEDDDEDEE